MLRRQARTRRKSHLSPLLSDLLQATHKAQFTPLRWGNGMSRAIAHAKTASHIPAALFCYTGAILVLPQVKPWIYDAPTSSLSSSSQTRSQVDTTSQAPRRLAPNRFQPEHPRLQALTQSLTRIAALDLSDIREARTHIYFDIWKSIITESPAASGDPGHTLVASLFANIAGIKRDSSLFSSLQHFLLYNHTLIHPQVRCQPFRSSDPSGIAVDLAVANAMIGAPSLSAIMAGLKIVRLDHIGKGQSRVFAGAILGRLREQVNRRNAEPKSVLDLYISMRKELAPYIGLDGEIMDWLLPAALDARDFDTAVDILALGRKLPSCSHHLALFLKAVAANPTAILQQPSVLKLATLMQAEIRRRTALQSSLSEDWIPHWEAVILVLARSNGQMLSVNMLESWPGVQWSMPFLLSLREVCIRTGRADLVAKVLELLPENVQEAQIHGKATDRDTELNADELLPRASSTTDLNIKLGQFISHYSPKTKRGLGSVWRTFRRLYCASQPESAPQAPKPDYVTLNILVRASLKTNDVQAEHLEALVDQLVSLGYGTQPNAQHSVEGQIFGSELNTTRVRWKFVDYIVVNTDQQLSLKRHAIPVFKMIADRLYGMRSNDSARKVVAIVRALQQRKKNIDMRINRQRGLNWTTTGKATKPPLPSKKPWKWTRPEGKEQKITTLLDKLEAYDT